MDEKPAGEVNGRVAPFERFRSICAAAGVDLGRVKPQILERVRLLSEVTETVKDCQRAADMAQLMFRYYEQEKPHARFSEVEQRTVVIGSLFSDIGKTGPESADAAGQRLVAEMFAVERVPDDKMVVADFFRRYFPRDSAQRVQRFVALGLDPSISMREFWNMHSAWTLRIMQGDGLPLEAVAAAATHHILENVNPDSIVAHDGRFTRYFGENERVDRPEKLVILLDKYDASRRRAQRSHEQAIEFLRTLIASNPHFGGDAEFFSLIDDLDVVLRDEGNEIYARLSVPPPPAE